MCQSMHKRVCTVVSLVLYCQGLGVWYIHWAMLPLLPPPTMSSRINELLKLIMLLCLGMYQTGSSSYIHTYIQTYMYHLLCIHTYMQIV